MKIHLRTSSKLMGAGMVMSLGWFLFEGCDCESTKADRHPGNFVVCMDNGPTLVYYSGNLVVPTSSVSFDPKQYDCTHPLSEAYGQSNESGFPTPSPVRTQSVRQADAAGSGPAYLPPPLRHCPFLPPVPIPASPPAPHSSSPHVLHTVQTNAHATRRPAI